MRDVCISPDGRVFISLSNRDGRGNPQTGDDKIVEISAKSASPTFTDTQNEDEFKVSLDPSDGIVHLTIPEPFKGGLIRVYNIIGKQVLQKRSTRSEESINTQNLPGGIYIFMIQKDNRKLSKKILLRD